MPTMTVSTHDRPTPDRPTPDRPTPDRPPPDRPTPDRPPPDRPPTTSTGELLLAARAGDSAAWEEIVRRYGRLVTAKVRTFRLQDADVLDAVQMTWLRLAENAHRVQHPEYLAGWLATTAGREALRILRRAKRSAEPTEIVEKLADPRVGPEARVLDAETAQALRHLVAELPPRRRTLLAALFSEGRRPYAEVSRTTGIPVGSIGPTLARALRQLRLMLEEQGLGPGERPGP